MKGLPTYCNPLPIPDIPRGCDEWLIPQDGMFDPMPRPTELTGTDYRSISDPTVFYWQNKWYLYPSYGMAWVSEDFCSWKHISTSPYCPKYSPAIIPWKGRFLLTSWQCPLYVGDTPTGPFTRLGSFIGLDGKEFLVTDPALFVDDDGKIYLYGFNMIPQKGSRFAACVNLGWELDPDNPRQVLQGPVEVQRMDPQNHPWERFGPGNQNTAFGWTEGIHMIKHGGRYYMIYAAPNTQFANYCMAVYYSDEGPLSGFICQKNNPLTIHKEGIVRGCGHGCVEHGPNNTLWAFYTVAVPYLHNYERRIGMDLVAVDQNGELYCPHGVTDTPQYAPGVVDEPVAQNSPLLCILNEWHHPVASSVFAGRDTIYASDGSALTWWQPDPEDIAPTLTYELDAPYDVSGIRLFWREIGLDYDKGILPGPVQYIIEYREELPDSPWLTLLDCSDNAIDYNIDYRSFPVRLCSQIRIRITGKPAGLQIGITDFAIFGKMSSTVK